MRLDMHNTFITQIPNKIYLELDQGCCYIIAYSKVPIFQLQFNEMCILKTYLEINIPLQVFVIEQTIFLKAVMGSNSY